jgi:uncharacterized protein YceH (UPF0502 family)
MELSFEEGRVIGSLVEKQLTTPQQYPLTLNALVMACNQSSNRDPVVAYSEHLVEVAVATLRDAGLVGFMYPSHGRTVTRYRHVLSERLGLDERELALVAVLLLRGPQTAGELRARTERMALFDGIGAVDADLERLSKRQEPLVLRLPRRPGQKEERWAQLLTAEGATQQVEAAAETGAITAGRAQPTARAVGVADAGAWGHSDQRLIALSDEVTELRAEVAELRAALEQLQEQLGG